MIHTAIVVRLLAAVANEDGVVGGTILLAAAIAESDG